MVALRLVQGARSIQFDLWPRTQEQMNHQAALVADLEAQHIPVSNELLDLRLLTEDEIELIRDNREAFAEASNKLGIFMKEKLKGFEALVQQRHVAGEFPQVTEWIAIREIADEVKAEFANDQFTSILNKEIDRAMQRMADRKRSDDEPKLGYNRLASYEKDTHPGIVRANGIPMISTLRDPDVVVMDIINQLLPVDLSNNVETDVRSIYTTTAGQIANIVVTVNKELKGQDEATVNAEIESRILQFVKPNLAERIQTALQPAA
jgi:adenylate kinase family enzyme